MDLSQVKEIEICYENCEVCKIDASFVKYISVLNPKMKFDKWNFPLRNKIVTGLEISILKHADKVGSLWMEEEREPFERTMCYPDIVYIYVIYKDGVKEKIVPPWDGNDYSNNNQSSHLDTEGNLIINITRKEK